MTTNNDDLSDRINSIGVQSGKEGVAAKGFQDPSGQFPRAGYHYAPSLNIGHRGLKRNDLATNGGLIGIDPELERGTMSEYPQNNVNETPSGHVIELDDTTGNERILIKHRTGAGIDIKPDGTIIISTVNNQITITNGDNHIIVEGDANMTYKGNVNMDVAGDYNVNVSGNHNLTVGGDYKGKIDGNKRETIVGNVGSTVSGNRSITTKGSVVETGLGGMTRVVKGNQVIAAEGSVTISASGNLKMSSEVQGILSAPDINIAATDLSVFGETGTIGGENIVMYNYNMFTGHSISAGDTITVPIVYGDLDGTADKAITADVTNSQNYADTNPGGDVGSAQGFTIDTTIPDPKVTAMPTSTLLNTYLTKSAFGIQKVKVDIGDFLFNQLDRTKESGGISSKPLTTGEVRSKLRDNGHLNNKEFTSAQVAQGKLSQSYASTVPPAMGRSSSSKPSRRGAGEIMGNVSAANILTKFISKLGQKQYTPDPKFNPNNQDNIGPATKLGIGITLAKFLGGAGEATNMNHIVDSEARKAIARQLYLQAVAMTTVMSNNSTFKNHRLVVVEGLYKKGPVEKLAPDGLNDLATKGQVVVYKLINKNGNMDNLMTYDLAVYWKDTLLFDKLILDYDTFDPSGKLESHIILVMPVVGATFSGKYSKKIETRFNGNLQSDNELVEIKEKS